MIELGEQVLFGKGTDENDARRMLKEAAKKRCTGIDESRIKLIIKKDRGYITGAWYVKVKEKEYIRILEADNVKKDETIQMLQAGNARLMNTIDEACEKTVRLERERDAAVADIHKTCSTCKHYYYNRQDDGTEDCPWFDGCKIEDHWEWRGVQEPPEEE